MRRALLLVFVCLIPVPSFAQGTQSFVQGFGGLRIAAAPTATPTAGATVGIGITPYIQAVGEFGHMADILPTTYQTLLSISPVGFHRSAMYGEGGVRLTTPAIGHVGAYGETLFGLARISNNISGIGSAQTDALTNFALRFVSTTGRVGALGTGVILQGGPVFATIGYRYTRIFSNNAIDSLLMGDHADVNEGRVSFGFRF
jgi:hypothetical protein